MSNTTFRPATLSDARFIARHVLEALHWEMYSLPLTPEKENAWQEMTHVCQTLGTLYSFEHATIACSQEEAVGLLVAYDGSLYKTLRQNTFDRLPSFAHQQVATMEDETQAGEYYIDSLAVIPSQRGCGRGRRLLSEAVKQAHQRGLLPSLLVDPDNSAAQRLYSSVGFVREGEIFAFGQIYWRMVHHL